MASRTEVVKSQLWLCYRRKVVVCLLATIDPLSTRKHVVQMRQIEIDQLLARPLHERVLSDADSYSLFDGDHF